MAKQGFVYITSNSTRTVLYVGVTSNLERRLYQHKHKMVPGFTAKYNCTDLIWWECADSMMAAIQREKQIKGWKRSRKDALVAELNPLKKDLSKSLFGWK